jgi:phage gp29-like protein
MDTPDIPDQLAQPGKPDLTEIAVSGDGRDITVPFMGALLEVRDTVLQRLGNNFEAYRELRRDDQVKATFGQRELALTSRPLVIEPGAKDAQSIAAAEHLRQNLKAIAFDRTCGKMLWGVFYGHAVAECLFEIRDGKVWMARAKVRTPWRFRYDPKGKLRLLTQANMTTGELMPDRKFWTFNAGADNDDDPYGLGLAHQLYWPVFFKKQGLGFWLRALEKFGAPSTVVKYPAGAGKDVAQKALAVARALRIDGAAAVPDTMVLELLEAMRGTVDQATFHRQMQASIAKIILGQTMTTDDGASLAQGKVHEGVKEELVDADAELQCESFQTGPATWLTQWNFPGATTPQISRPSPEDEGAAADLVSKKAGAIKAARDAGLEPDEATRVKIMGPGWTAKAEPAEPEPAPNLVPFKKPAQAAFAEPTDPDDAIDDFSGALDWEPVMDPILGRLVAAFGEEERLDGAAIQARLAGLLAGEGLSPQLREQLARPMFEARLAGEAGLMLSASQDADEAAS